MFEARCPTPKCKKNKLGELGRKPISGLAYSEICKCGRKVEGKISTRPKTDEIIALLDCPCGYRKEKVVGHIFAVKCRKCKKIIKF